MPLIFLDPEILSFKSLLSINVIEFIGNSTKIGSAYLIDEAFSLISLTVSFKFFLLGELKCLSNEGGGI
ncbi:MAG: hypothetical protein H0V82_11065 [Candidatus Protochlamydia sp.]|nr:hypothetical protein [Candidatus Protochlamydia sp.]